jgi:hypothetical protein
MQGGLWPPLAHPLPRRDVRQGLVNRAEDGDNEVVQVHGALLRSLATGLEDSMLIGPGFPLSLRPAHGVR